MSKRKVKCKMCGEECCTCLGCNPNTYVDKLCPSCQKKIKNAVTSDKGMQELQQSQGTS